MYIIILILGIIVSTSTILADDDEIILNSKKFAFILNALNSKHPDSLNIQELSEKAFDLMLKEVDPYSNYISKKEFKNFVDRSRGSKYRIGIKTVFINDTLRIVNIDEDSDAYKSEKNYKTRILSINETEATKVNNKKIKQILEDDSIKVVSLDFVDEDGIEQEITMLKEDIAKLLNE